MKPLPMRFEAKGVWSVASLDTGKATNAPSPRMSNGLPPRSNRQTQIGTHDLFEAWRMTSPVFVSDGRSCFRAAMVVQGRSAVT
jgi:hypothetical protein